MSIDLLAPLAVGDIVRIGGDSILRGQAACVIRDDGSHVYCCSNGTFVGADFPIRHLIPKGDIHEY